MQEKKENRGGLRAGAGRKTKKEPALTHKFVSVCLREDWLAQIELLRGDSSRHKWILSAIEEKLSKGENEQAEAIKTIFKNSDGSFEIKKSQVPKKIK